MEEWIKLIIPWSISLVSLIIVIITFAKNGKKDQKQEYTEESAKFDGIKEALTKANIKLDTVCATTNETRSDIKALNRDIAEIDKRVVAVEQDLKTAFKRIDELKEGKEDKK